MRVLTTEFFRSNYCARYRYPFSGKVPRRSSPWLTYAGKIGFLLLRCSKSLLQLQIDTTESKAPVFWMIQQHVA